MIFGGRFLAQHAILITVNGQVSVLYVVPAFGAGSGDGWQAEQGRATVWRGAANWVHVHVPTDTLYM